MIEDFFKIAANLKNIPRQGWIDKLGMISPESVADHSYSTSLMAMVFGDNFNLNSEKLLKMSLIHDLAESITGDLTPGKISSEEKIQLENKAMEEIFAQLPPLLRDSYFSIWTEFQENQTKEAQLIHDIDKLEMILQASIYSKKGYSPKSFNTFLDSASSIQNPELIKILSSLKKNFIFKNE